MNVQQITKLQNKTGYGEMQEMINTGQCWMMEGYTGRQAMTALRIGACMLPLEPKVDFYGQRVPSRTELKAGTPGTFQNCVDYWQEFVDSGFEHDYQYYI